MTEPPKKPGRKPIGKTAMTTAERQKRWRDKKRGATEKKLPMEKIAFSVDGSYSDTIKRLADVMGIKRSEVLRMLILFGLKEACALTSDDRLALEVIASSDEQASKESKEAIQLARRIKRDALTNMLHSVQEMTKT